MRAQKEETMKGVDEDNGTNVSKTQVRRERRFDADDEASTQRNDWFSGVPISC